jgi:probable HAF family extracellular repeat protein
MNKFTVSAVITYAFFYASVSAAEGQKNIHFDGHSELVRRLMLDLNLNKPSKIKSNNTEYVSSSQSLYGNEGRAFSHQELFKKNSFPNKNLSPYSSRKKYRITDLGTLGGTESFAYAINDSGVVVGKSRTKGDIESHSFYYHNGIMSDLYPLDSQDIQASPPIGINKFGLIASGVINNVGIYSPALYDKKTSDTFLIGSLGGVTSYGFNGVAADINDSGQAVGYSYIDSIERHAFLYSNGQMKDIGSFGGYSAALAINNKGQAVGFASDLVNGRAHAFMYANGVMTDIDPLQDFRFNMSESYARDINNRGQVVGEFLTKDQRSFHGFIYNKGVTTEFAQANSPNTVPYAINDKGQVVGIIDVPYKGACFDYNSHQEIPCTKYKFHAFTYSKGNLIDLNTLFEPLDDWELVWAFDINNHEEIVGYGLRNGKFRAYLLTPIKKTTRNGFRLSFMD